MSILLLSSPIHVITQIPRLWLKNKSLRCKPMLWMKDSVGFCMIENIYLSHEHEPRHPNKNTRQWFPRQLCEVVIFMYRNWKTNYNSHLLSSFHVPAPVWRASHNFTQVICFTTMKQLLIILPLLNMREIQKILIILPRVAKPISCRAHLNLGVWLPSFLSWTCDTHKPSRDICTKFLSHGF